MEVGQRYLSQCSSEIGALIKQRSFASEAVSSFSTNEDAQGPHRGRVYSSFLQRRLIRDSRLVQRLKIKFQNKCCVCGWICKIDHQVFYSEAAHVRPLGFTHSGPDSQENIVILCPNHHTELDNGILSIDPETRNFIKLNGSEIIFEPGARAPSNLDQVIIEYHYNKIFRGKSHKI